MESKYYKKGKSISITEIKQLAAEKKYIFVETITGLTIYPAFELLYWQLKSLLRVKLYEAIFMGEQISLNVSAETEKPLFCVKYNQDRPVCRRCKLKPNINFKISTNEKGCISCSH